MVDFIFYSNVRPYKMQQKITVEGEHYECGMLVIDKRFDINFFDNFLLAAMFTVNATSQICCIVKFLQDGINSKTFNQP